jgi:protein-tyrosine phosphatase
MNSPLSNSYWVVAGRLLAGEHPYGTDEANARSRLRFLRSAGINYFIDLTQPHEMPEYRHLLPVDTKYLRSPIADVEVPREVAQMQDIQKRIRAALLFGRCVYVHCRAGIGRTGTVAG